MGFIDFTNGEVLTAAQMDTTFRQTVMRFADAAERDTELSGVLAEGMLAYLDDTNEVLKYDGSQWVDISGDITGVTAGTALTGGGTSGNVTLDVDTAAVGSAIGIDSKQDNVITTQGDLIIGDASGDPSRLAIGTADTILTSNGTTATWVAAGVGFDTIDVVTASDSSYDVSSISGFARITIIGAGGGGSYQQVATTAGGSSSVTIGGTTTTASGGAGGSEDTPEVTYSYASFNGGSGWHGNDSRVGSDGNGGEIKVIYADLTSVSTINISIGAGGSGSRRDGFRGEVHLEYLA